MTDESLGDLLGDMDELDSALFGRSTGSKAKPSLRNIDSLLGDTKKPTARKTTVSFLDTSATAATAPAQHAPTKSALDDLFTDTSNEQKHVTTSSSTATAIQRPSRHSAGATTLGSLLGQSLSEKVSKPAASTVAQVPIAALAPQVTGYLPEDNLRTRRLENEVERLNREIEEIKIRKKDDEQEIERLWRDKLSKKDIEHQEELNEVRSNQEKHLLKVEQEHFDELQRLKITYERQLDTIQKSVMQWNDVSTVVDKVDMLSSTIHELTDNVTSVADRSVLEKEAALRLREQQLENREERLIEERNRFIEEREKVHELNSKLYELCKGQETTMEQEKYRVREEWNRLNAEKLVFKEDQRFILENIEKQKMALEKSKTAFFQEQHDLLVRICTERQLLEQDKSEFHGKRSADVKRLKEEAGELQRRTQNILSTERQFDEMKKHYEIKMRQLQELEMSLMEECVEMENIRNQLSTQQIRISQKGSTNYDVALNNVDNDTLFYHDDQSGPPRNESVRTVLKKHSEFLERYMGQKVAAVAPRPAKFDSP